MLETLYSKGKKEEIRVWRVWTEGASILSEHGTLEGKMQIDEKIAKPKNVGRANETTPAQQAVSQAESMWKKKLDKGYFPSIEEAKTTKVFLPMLASKFEDKKHNLTYPCDVQPKLDGVRCLAFWEGDKVKLLSRGGKEYNVPHLKKELERVLTDKTQVLDGEIYIHGASLQEVNRLVKKNRPESVNLQYWIYDTFLIDGEVEWWHTRLSDLEMFFENYEGSILEQTTTTTAQDEARVYELQGIYVEAGFEGAIVREGSAPYALGNRSSKLLKVKSFKDEEFPIVGFGEGEGRFESCVIWVCQTPEGKTFKVVPKGTIEQKKKWFSEAEKYIDQYLKVKFFSYTEDNLPQFPVGLDIRLEEDM